jgi:hypothetical protein
VSVSTKKEVKQVDRHDRQFKNRSLGRTVQPALNRPLGISFLRRMYHLAIALLQLALQLFLRGAIELAVGVLRLLQLYGKRLGKLIYNIESRP